VKTQPFLQPGRNDLDGYPGGEQHQISHSVSNVKESI
jgi:hypothetical protein